MDEMMFQLRAPLEGTGDGIIIRGVLESVLPALLLTVLTGVLYYIERKRNTAYTNAHSADGSSLMAAVLIVCTRLVPPGRDLTWETI